ncbi:U32 family peptidase [Alkaliphilus oremlandii]|uniref:Peptidase U32 n=1 Tax=Alkaliphilus oremlandii (strain OhILAs) TaxID=350688 RepID=A8MI75_ALKOO|nr:U32 family peptidase [Alkaliphilus oremlandii]ABW19507.1 peptidase U32 [Alkaliphilus oremlandii OhILAs]
MQQIELLAPAGNLEALKAAVQNGADAIYLGGQDFGARAYASNFDREAMKEAVSYAHIRGVKVYVTVNILVKDEEIETLMEYIKFLYEIDVDAVIVQDMGVFHLIKELFPDFEIHASTQMTLHNRQGVEVLKEMGVSRVVLSREVTIEEIKDIYDATGMELEVFIHGALCVSYSGQCLMSSFIGGRSGNRGRCAQPCRRQYNLLKLNRDKEILKSGEFLNKGRSFHLSMRDLNTLEEIGQLIEAGVTSFKIEGRMKKPQYVASIVRGYRKAIDLYLSDRKALKDDQLQEEIAQMFNRKFTKGHLFHSPKAEVINIEKPNNRGLYLGRIEDVNRKENRFRIKLEVDIAVGDGVEIWNESTDDMGGNIRNIYRDHQLVKEAKKGEVVELEMRCSVQKGDQVYKTLNLSLMDALEKTYAQDKEYKKIPLYGKVQVELNEKIKVCLWDNEGHAVEAKSDAVVEAALKVAVTEEKLLEQLSKLGNTPFQLEHLDVSLGENCSVPVSVLNSLRREIVDQLMDLRKNRHNRETIENQDFNEKLRSWISNSERKNKEPLASLRLSVKVDTLHQLKEVLKHDVGRVYYEDIATFKDAIGMCREKNTAALTEIYLRTPNILRNSEYDRLENLVEGLSFDGILAGDVGLIRWNKEHANLPVFGDYTLNVFNRPSIHAFEGLDFNGITLSPELDFNSLYQLDFNNALEKEAMIYGKVVVMTTEYCPFIQENQCDHNCNQCRYPKYHYNFGLNDAKNVSFPIAKNYWGRTIILNSKPLFMIDRLHEFKDVPVQWLRLEFTDETIEEIKELLELAEKNIHRALTGEKSKEDIEVERIFKDGFTRGHYYRGVE